MFTRHYRCLLTGIPYDTHGLWMEYAKCQGSMLTVHLYRLYNYLNYLFCNS